MSSDKTPLVQDGANSTASKRSLIVKGVVVSVVSVVLVGLFLYIPAWFEVGMISWSKANIFIVTYLVVMTSCQVATAIYAAESLKSRLKPVISKDQDPRDKYITIAILFSVMGIYISVPVIVFRTGSPFRLSETAYILGLVVNVIGFLIIQLASFRNKFATTNVREQEGQVLVDTGVYAYVRHPTYSGLLLYAIGFPLWFDSIPSLGFVLLLMLALQQRMNVEEGTLMESLESYRDYKERVPCRIVPFCV